MLQLRALVEEKYVSREHAVLLQAYSRSSATVWDAVDVVSAKKVILGHKDESDETDDVWYSELVQVVAGLHAPRSLAHERKVAFKNGLAEMLNVDESESKGKPESMETLALRSIVYEDDIAKIAQRFRDMKWDPKEERGDKSKSDKECDRYTVCAWYDTPYVPGLESAYALFRNFQVFKLTENKRAQESPDLVAFQRNLESYQNHTRKVKLGTSAKTWSTNPSMLKWWSEC